MDSTGSPFDARRHACAVDEVRPSGSDCGCGHHGQAPRSTPFEIWLVWSDRRLTVPSGETALKVLQEAGVPVDPGCLAGGCGSCATEYVEGDLVHKDACLSAGDRERMFCPCVSRARGVLVLPF